MLRRTFEQHMQQLAQAPARVREVREFFAKCTDAGPDQGERLKLEAQKLLVRAGFNSPIPEPICSTCGVRDPVDVCRCLRDFLSEELDEARAENERLRAQLAAQRAWVETAAPLLVRLADRLSEYEVGRLVDVARMMAQKKADET